MGKGAAAVQLSSSLVNADPKNLDARLALVQALRVQGDTSRAGARVDAAARRGAEERCRADRGRRGRPGPAGSRRPRPSTSTPRWRSTRIPTTRWPAGSTSWSHRRTLPEAVKRADARLAKHPKDPATLALGGPDLRDRRRLAKSEALLEQVHRRGRRLHAGVLLPGPALRPPEAARRGAPALRRHGQEPAGQRRCAHDGRDAAPGREQAGRGQGALREDPAARPAARSWRPTTWPTWTPRRDRSGHRAAAGPHGGQRRA